MLVKIYDVIVVVVVLATVACCYFRCLVTFSSAFWFVVVAIVICAILLQYRMCEWTDVSLSRCIYLFMLFFVPPNYVRHKHISRRIVQCGHVERVYGFFFIFFGWHIAVAITLLLRCIWFFMHIFFFLLLQKIKTVSHSIWL